MWVYREGTFDLRHTVAVVIMPVYQEGSITMTTQAPGGPPVNIEWRKGTVVVVSGTADLYVSGPGELVAIQITYAQIEIVPQR